MKKRSFTILLLLSVYLSSFAQTTHKAQSITNHMTDKHLNVAGTKISLVPPAGFVATTTFTGFQQVETSASIVVAEIPGPYDEMAKGFTKEAIKTRGVDLLTKETLQLNGYPATLIRAEQAAYGSTFSKLILFFGNKEQTIMLNGMCPKDAPNLLKELEVALFSAVYQPNKVVNPLGSASFEVTVAKTKLKFAAMMTGMLMYSVDGKVPTQSTDKTNLTVGSSLAQVAVKDAKLYAINHVKQLPVSIKIDPANIKPLTIDAISGYEIVAYGQDPKTKKPEMVYQVMLFSDDLYYLIVGTANDDFPANLALFKSVSSTFRRK